MQIILHTYLQRLRTMPFASAGADRIAVGGHSGIR